MGTSNVKEQLYTLSILHIYTHVVIKVAEVCCALELLREIIGQNYDAWNMMENVIINTGFVDF